MVVKHLTLLLIILKGGLRPLLFIMGNGVGRRYVITHHGEWWWTILRYYPLLGMVVKDLTLLPTLRMVVNDITLLPIITNAGGRLDVITNIWEWWWTT